LTGDEANLTGIETNLTGDSATLPGGGIILSGDELMLPGGKTNLSGETAGLSGEETILAGAEASESPFTPEKAREWPPFFPDPSRDDPFCPPGSCRVVYGSILAAEKRILSANYAAAM
jgi:hypothetical protein